MTQLALPLGITAIEIEQAHQTFGFQPGEIISVRKDPELVEQMFGAEMQRETIYGVVTGQAGEIVYFERPVEGSWARHAAHITRHQVVQVPGLCARVGYIILCLRRFGMQGFQYRVPIGAYVDDPAFHAALLKEGTGSALWVFAACKKDWRITWEHRRAMLADNRELYREFLSLLVHQQAPEATILELLDERMLDGEDRERIIIGSIKSVELLIEFLRTAVDEAQIIAIAKHLSDLKATDRVPPELVAKIETAREERAESERIDRIRYAQARRHWDVVDDD